MRYVCFTGHRVLEKEKMDGVKSKLKQIIENFLLNGVRLFYMAEAGDFDKLTLSTLKTFNSIYPDLVTVALHGKNKTIPTNAKYSVKLNNFAVEYQSIIANSEALVCYVRKQGCAFKLIKYAQTNNIPIINLFDLI